MSAFLRALKDDKPSSGLVDLFALHEDLRMKEDNLLDVDCLDQIYSRGHEVFEDEDRFLGWLHAPSRYLGGIRPIDLAQSEAG